jgi:hypothetical protein
LNGRGRGFTAKSVAIEKFKDGNDVKSIPGGMNHSGARQPLGALCAWVSRSRESILSEQERGGRRVFQGRFRTRHHCATSEGDICLGPKTRRVRCSNEGATSLVIKSINQWKRATAALEWSAIGGTGNSGGPKVQIGEYLGDWSEGVAGCMGYGQTRSRERQENGEGD